MEDLEESFLGEICLGRLYLECFYCMDIMHNGLSQ